MPDPGDSTVVQFTMTRQHGRVVDVTTNVAAINHFLAWLKLSRSYHTWLNYAHDLKFFFQVIPKPPDKVGRGLCGVYAAARSRPSTIGRPCRARLVCTCANQHGYPIVFPIV